MNRYRLFALLLLLALLAVPLTGTRRVYSETVPGLATESEKAIDAGVPADWWAAVQQEIGRSEYEITRLAELPLPAQEDSSLPDLSGSYQAPNRAQNLRTYFTPAGLVVVPRLWPAGEGAPPWQWGLRLSAWGRADAVQPVGTPLLEPAGNRIDYRYGSGPPLLVEWYVNDERGLEQGFTLNQPPGWQPAEGEVVLDLTLSGDLIPRLADGDQAIEFNTTDGTPVLCYAGLQATDAGGRALPVHLELYPAGIRLVVDASAAAYPITVDPLLMAPGWMTESNQADAQWGTSVAMAGDVNGDGYDDVVVGAPYYDDGYTDRGEVFVFYGSVAGPANSFSARMTGYTADARLGTVVGPAGDVDNDGYDDLVASAPGDGYVAVYFGSDTGPTNSWQATAASVDDYFGVAAGTAGDVNGDGYDDLIVGAMNADSLATNAGAVYVWLGSSTGLGDPGTPANADWTATSGQTSAHFGRSAGTAGDLNGDGYDDIVVGANSYDNPDSNEGAIFVWYGSSSGLGAAGLPANADWSAQSNQAQATLGTAAGTAGDVNGDGYDDLLASAFGYDGSQANGGRAYAFYGSVAGLSCGGGCPVDANTAADWLADGSQSDAGLGYAAATAGDVDGDGYDDVVLGVPYDNSGQAGAGRAYLFYGSATGLNADATWSAGGGQENEMYGWSVAGGGDVNGDGCDDLLVGAPFYDHGETDEGRAYLYYGSPLALGPGAAWSALGGQKGAHLGTAVDTAGDLNGDGFSDVVVGVPNYDNPTLGGRVLVYYGSEAGLPASASWTATGDQALGEFGAAVATAGDLNGDGYADLAIGAPQYDHTGLAGAGAAFVYLGSAAGLGDPGTPANADWFAYGDQAGAELGHDLGTAGDVNGDHYDDLIVGAPFYNAEWGRAYVFHGSAHPDATPDWIVDSPVAEGNFGYSVDTAGDVNADLYADVIVGAPHAAHVYVYYGSASGLPASSSWDAFNTQGDSQYGYAVATAGDANGDGYSDVAIGAPDYDSNGASRGRVYVSFGSKTGLTGTWLTDGGQPNARLGWAVSTAGDVNGDGYADLIAGAPYADGSSSDDGQAFLYYGGPGTPAVGHGWAISGRASARLGAALGTAGDVNGDGYSDVIVGGPLYSASQMQEGWAAVYYGGSAMPHAAPDWTAQQAQADSHLGDAVGTAGDVNGDGYADVIVGAPSYDAGEADEGRVWVYLGDSDGLHANAAWTAEGNQVGAHLGAALGTAGDVNGDGYADVVVGAPGYDAVGSNDGLVLVWYGSATGLGPDGSPANADWQFQGIYSSSNMGASVGTAGDVNGDGYADLVVGAPGFESAWQDQGRVCLVAGSAAGLSGVAWEVYGDQASALLGSAVGTAGDVNGDGYSDLVVGASNYSGEQIHAGRIYVYHGSAAGLEATPAAVVEGSGPDAYLGGSAGTAGDVNGDGYSDVIVGAGTLSLDQLYEGRAYVYYGSPTGIDGGGAPWWAEGNQMGAYLGNSVSTAGDVNGDGYADVIVGVHGYDDGQSDRGRAYIYLGSAGGLGYAPAWVTEGEQASVHLGLAVGTAGDVNGDGYADVIVGSGGYFSGGAPDKQRAHVFYGNGGGGYAYELRQMQPRQLDLISPLGLSNSCTMVRLGVGQWMPLGRDRVKLQWQIAPLGTSFDAANGVVSGVTSSWADTGDHLLLPFLLEVPGLQGGTPYHWRVRLVYDAGNRLGQAAGPWLHLPGHAWSEQDFRTPYCQVYLPLTMRGNQ